MEGYPITNEAAETIWNEIFILEVALSVNIGRELTEDEQEKIYQNVIRSHWPKLPDDANIVVSDKLAELAGNI